MVKSKRIDDNVFIFPLGMISKIKNNLIRRTLGVLMLPLMVILIPPSLGFFILVAIVLLWFGTSSPSIITDFLKVIISEAKLVLTYWLHRVWNYSEHQ